MLNVVKHLIADLHVADRSFAPAQDDKLAKKALFAKQRGLPTYIKRKTIPFLN